MKQAIQSSLPQEYFMRVIGKKASGKRLNQAERIYLELYWNTEIPCYFFTKQMSPSILQYNARIFKLRQQGFIIKCECHMVGKDKHSVYILDKAHIEVEQKKAWWQELW